MEERLKEILKKVRKINIRSRRLVNDVFAGEYESVFKGRGMDFAEVREYQPGDEIRMIDWNVTARMGHPYVKIFTEERELTIMLLMDLSSSAVFGTVKSMKNEIAAEIGGLLAFSAVKNNDKVGLIGFTEQIEKYVPPAKGEAHVLRILRDLFYFVPPKKRTNIGEALEFLNKVSRKRAVVFLVSDFIAGGFEMPLKIANKRHDIICIIISDPRERNLPRLGFIQLEDAETGEQLLVNTQDSGVIQQFTTLTGQNISKQEQLFRALNIDTILISTAGDYIKPLLRFFRGRARRFR